MVSPDGVAPSRMVSVSASVNLPLHHNVHRFSSGTGSPGWSRKKGRKMVVVVVAHSSMTHLEKLYTGCNNNTAAGSTNWVKAVKWWVLLKWLYNEDGVHLRHWPRETSTDVHHFIYCTHEGRLKTSLIPHNQPTHQRTTGPVQSLDSAYWISLLYCSALWQA